jgi:hypothetical protein
VEAQKGKEVYQTVVVEMVVFDLDGADIDCSSLFFDCPFVHTSTN